MRTQLNYFLNQLNYFIMKVTVAIPNNYNNSTQHSTYPVIGINNGNSNYGYIMLASESTAIVDGWIQKQRRVARMAGEVSMLEDFVKAFNIKEGTILNSIPGMENTRLVIEESHEAFYPGMDCKRYPDNSERAGQAVLSEGKEVYRQTIVDTSGSKQDRLLATDKIPVDTPIKMPVNSEFDKVGSNRP